MRRLIGAVREADWLDAPRARIYARILLATGLLLTVAFYVAILSPAIADAAHRPLGSDFDTFWAGALLALHGHAADVYDLAAIHAAEAVGAQLKDGRFYVYLYPPTFLALSLPLALLPYLAALPLFLAAGCAAMLAGLRRILPPAWPWIALVALPAGLLNIVVGQNGFVTAACFAGALLCLEARPVLAGALLGLLACKPHLAAAVPFMLLAARRWSALASCATSAAGLVLASWLLLGTAAWQAFFHASGVLQAMMGSADIWPKMLSLYAGARLLGAGQGAALALQAGLALVALACAIRVAAARPGAGAEVSVMVAAAMLVSPYIWDYDQVCLAVPMAWLAAEASKSGWRAWEKITLAALYLLPVTARALNMSLGLPIAPLLLLALLVILTRRSKRTRVTNSATDVQKSFASFLQKSRPAFSEATWLTPDRARAYGRVAACGSVLFGLACVALFVASAWSDPAHQPIANDFTPFWSAARLALHGHAGLAYSTTAIREAEAAVTQRMPGGRLLPYMYPPIFLALTLPLALLGYVPALLAFVLSGYAAFVTLIRRLLPRGWPWLSVVAFPGAIVNAVVGQNGFLSAACFAGAALLLDARPALGGACLGVLVFKPHLALCVPVLLVCGQRWRALAASAATAAGLVLLSAITLGAASWAAFLAAAPAIGVIMRLPNVYGGGGSLYAAVLILGGSLAAAWAAQAASALAAMACLVRIGRQRPGAAAEVACLAAAALLSTPYVMDYDLVCLAVPLAWMAARGSATGWRPWEKIALAAAYLLPLFARTLSTSGVPLVPVLVWWLMLLLAGRALHAPARRASLPAAMAVPAA